MLYGIIAVFGQMPFSNDGVFGRLGRRLHAASRASSGQAVEYALTSPTLLFTADDLPAAFPPNGRPMAEDEASLEVAPCAENCTAISPANITLSEKYSDNDKYGTGSLVTRKRPVALERGRGRLYKLVCANGPRRRRSTRASAFRFRRGFSRAGSRRIMPNAFLPAGKPRCRKCTGSTLPCARRCDARRRPRRLPPRSTSAAPNGPMAGPRRSCARPRSRRFPPVMTRSAARRSIRA